MTKEKMENNKKTLDLCIKNERQKILYHIEGIRKYTDLLEKQICIDNKTDYMYIGFIKRNVSEIENSFIDIATAEKMLKLIKEMEEE